MKAAARLDEGKPSLALEECNTGLSSSKDYRLYILKGKALLGLGKINEAEKAFNLASQLAPGSGAYGMAYIYTGRGDYKRAVSSLEIHLRSEYKHSEKHIILDPKFKKLESSGEWKELWSKDWYNNLENGIAEAEYFSEKGRLDELADLVEYLGLQYAGNSGMEYIKALYYRAGGEHKKELEHFRLAIAGKQHSSKEIWRGYIEALLDAGDYFEAIEASVKALEQFPEELDFLLQKAESLRLSGDRDEAMKTIELFLEVSPANEDGLLLAGNIAMERQNYSTALRYYSSGIKLYPGNPDNYIRRGDVYSLTSTWEFAIDDYAMALDLNPENGYVYYSRASALLKTGKRDDACRNFRMALKHGYKKASVEINRNCIR